MKAKFKTAYLQREILLDIALATAVQVGDVVIVGADGRLALKTGSTVAVGDYIVAQSDQTVGYGHVPVENRDYRYSPIVAASMMPKKVAVYMVNNVSDVIVYTA